MRIGAKELLSRLFKSPRVQFVCTECSPFHLPDRRATLDAYEASANGPRSSETHCTRPNILATWPTLGSGLSSLPLFEGCSSGKWRRSRTIPRRAGDWRKGDGIELCELPTAFGVINLRAQRTKSRIIAELSLTGPAPEWIMFRYAGAKRAQADGLPCEIYGDVIISHKFKRLVVE